MPSLVLRLWVLLLAVLFQAGGWHSEANSSASAAAPLVAHDDAGDCDAPEDSTEELSSVDDSSGNDVVPPSVPNWSNPPVSARSDAWVDGLPPGGPPADTPFKPPRA